MSLERALLRWPAGAGSTPLSRRRCLGLALVASAAAAGCAVRPTTAARDAARAAVATLLHDAAFAPPVEQPDRAAVLRPSADMEAFARRALGGSRQREARPALLQALFERDLKLVYDAGRTRDAAGTFAERAGNCLSLVLMTASLARLMDVPTTFQTVVVDDAATREGDYVVLSGHVNLVLGKRVQARTIRDEPDVVIDFLPAQQVAGYRALPLEEHQVLSLYMSNRAAEALVAGDTNAAYWWAREGLDLDPIATGVMNTLGVVYSRAGRPDAAEAAWRRALELAPRSTSVLANLVQHLRQQGRHAERAPLEARLAELQPVPPLHWYRLGRAAFDRGDYDSARGLFLRELGLQPEQAEVHFWLAATHARLGRAEHAVQDLTRAVVHSTSPAQKQLYAGKLARLRGLLTEIR